ncbi:MAG: primosomal protein N' [Gallionella sp.]
MSILRVALDVPLARLFDYSVAGEVAVGQRVIVPFGSRQLVGVVMACGDTSTLAPERIKPVSQVLADSAPLSSELLALLQFCSDYYHYPIGQTVMAALPAPLRSGKPLTRKVPEWFRLTERGAAWERADFPKRKAVQRRILTHLAEQPCALTVLKRLSATASAQVKALEAENWIERFTPADELIAVNNVIPHVFRAIHTLTPEQQRVVNAVTDSEGYRCFLLHGITGSGKTEVYVHLMQHILQRGGQVLLLVPEINLTPQLEHYFQQRFPDAALVSLHSGLSDAARLDNWQQAQAGTAQIVLGTRLSVFAELPKLALILVDEEHDSSFKQQDFLRYSARDVAIFRANQCGIPIVLGSATPSFETYHNAQTGRYQMLQLTARASAAASLPVVRCIHPKQNRMVEGISEKLLAAIEQRIARQEQSLLFINRRGYAPVLMCGGCGWLSGCPHCAGKMVLHLDTKRLRCHHCGWHMRVPMRCPDCGEADLQPIGSGTQRVEQVLQTRFPAARILRVDRDSTQNKRAWQTMRAQIHANEVDILVGTQMLAKGHDFPALTLVGVLNPDSALYSSDFRAAEKLFAQLVQVAGRAGRADKAGEVLIQTAFPDHPLFHALQTHDFVSWAASQLAERRLAGFPPFRYQAMLRAEGLVEEAVYDYLNQARAAAMALNHAVDVLGVVPAALPRRANHLRGQLLIQADSRKVLQQFLRAWQPALSALPAAKLHCSLDIDPLEF